MTIGQPTAIPVYENASKPRIAVILCAYTDERWEELRQAVDSLRAQTHLPDEILLVIDHNHALLEKARDLARETHAGPALTVIENHEAKGLSGARNSGITATSADLIGFLDDDASAAPDWLEQMLQALETHPRALGVSGWVVPQWKGRAPRWLPEEFYWVVGCTHRGQPTTTAEVRNLIGASMLIRRSVFEKVGGFRSEIGRIGAIPLGCEETELCIRARQQIPNSTFLIVPDARVFHNVPVKRTNWRYFQSRCYAEGVSKAVVSGFVGAGDALSSERAHALKTLPLGVLRGLKNTLLGRDRMGVVRSTAIIAGLGLTALGYLRGRTSARKTTLQAAVNHPLKLLMVSARYYPFTGGTETHIYEVARRLAADGQSLTILTTDPEGTLPRRETAAGVQIRRVRAYPRQRDYYFAPGILSAVIWGKWDVVHIQGYHTFVAPMAMLAAWISRTPYVVTFHSGGHSSAARNKMRGLQRRLLAPLLKRADQLIGVSEFEADFFAQSLGIDRSRFIVIPNGSHLPPLDEPITQDESPLIVSSGRLERYKGHHHVIAALAELLKKRSDVRLRIVGTGPYEPDLQAMIDTLGVRDHVEIGAIPSGDRQAMSRLLAQASLVVLFSEYEAHPVAVMEALSLRRPVLVADTSGLRELAQKGLVRALPLDSTPQQIAAAMIQQIDMPMIPDAVTLPTWESCAARLLQVYQQVAASGDSATPIAVVTGAVNPSR